MATLTPPIFVLRPPREHDVPAYAAYLADPEVSCWLEDRCQRPVPEADVAAFLLAGAWCRWAIECEGIFVGATGLHHPDLSWGAARFFIVIGDKRFWNRGLGTAAARAVVSHGFTTLGLRKIVSDYLEPNLASGRLHERAGFTVEGRLREDAWRQDRWVDRILVSVLRREHEARTAAER
jgi:RimJ/RimL family protein N-acetyltransferase